MHNPPKHKPLGFIACILLLVVLVGIVPTGMTLAAVNENFDGFPDNEFAENLVIPGIASIVSTPANSTAILNFALPAPFAGKSLANLTVAPAPADGTALITFTQPQDSYTFDFLVNLGDAASQFYVQGFRDGATVFTDTYNTPVNVAPQVGNGTGIIFDQIGISSTAGHWGIDNFQTTDAPPGISVSQTGVSTDVAETGPTSDTIDIALDSPPSDTVTIDLLTDGQCNAVPATVNFAAGQFAAQTITITAVDDGATEAPVHPCLVNFAISAAAAEYGAVTVPDLTVNVTDNDVPGFTVAPTTVTVIEGDSGTYDLSINTVPSADVSIDIIPDAGQCTVSTNNVTFTTSSVTSVTITVTATDDLIGEASPHNCLITHTVTTTDPNYIPLTPADVTLEITDNDVAGITVTPLNVSVAEGGVVPSSYSISLDMESVQPVTIDITVPDGQCTVNPINVTFPIGSVGPLAVDVTAVDDLVVEGAHSCTIQQAVTTTDPNYTGFVVPDVIGNITDNDIPGVTLDPMMVNVAEGGATDTYTVVLNSQPTDTVTVQITPDAQCTVNGSAAPITLTFNPAAAPLWNAAQTVTVAAVDDLVAEGTHNCTIGHQGTSTDGNYNATFGDVTGTITDNDAADVTLNPTAVAVSEAGVTDTYTVVLDSQPSASVTIQITPDAQCTVNGSAAPITLTFNPAAAPLWNAAQTVTVAAVDDLVVEGAHSCTISHQGISGDANYNIAFGDVTGTITDNDTAGVTLNPTAVAVSEAGVTAAYTVVLDSQPTAAVTIQITPDAQCTVNGSAVPITLTFNPAAAPLWNVSQMVTVEAVDDLVVEGTHNCTISHQGISGDANYNVAFGNVTGTITDNDAGGVTLNPTAVNVSEAGTTDTYTVVLDTQPTATVTIQITPDAQCTVNGSAAPITLTFNPAAAPVWNTPQTVTVGAVNDAVAEGTHNCTIGHQGTSADATYNATFGNVTGTITDDDVAGYDSNPIPGSAISITTTTGVNGTSPVVISENGAADLTISSYSITGGPELTVTGPAFPFTIVNGGPSQTLTITCNSAIAGNFNGILSVFHNGAGSPATYDVSCDVTGAPGYGSAPINPGGTINVLTSFGVQGTAVNTISETGNADLTINSYSIVGAPELTVTGPAFPFTIADGGASQNLTVLCNSPVNGVFNATLTVFHNAPGSPATYNVVCNVTNPTPVPAAGYGSAPAPGTPINITTPAGTAGTSPVVISETGILALDITSYDITGGPELTVTGPAFPFTIADGGASQTLTVVCNSTTPNTYTGTLSVFHNATGSPATYLVTCNVTGTGPVYSSNPLPAPGLGSTINISTTVGANVSATITVIEAGGADLVVGPISVAGSPQLTLNSATNFTIPDGGPNQTISILCNASSVGNFQTTVTVPHNGTSGATSPATYTVICDVTSSPTARYSSNPASGSTINLATTLNNGVGTNIQVTNTGGAALNVTSVALTGSGTGQISRVSPISFTLNPGASTNISLQCAATALGTFAVTVSVTHNGTPPPNSPATYTVNCTVTTTAGSPGYGSNPAPGSVIDLGAVLINTPITKTLTVFETGGAQLEVRVPGTGVVLGGANASEFRIIGGFPSNNQPPGTILFTIADGGAPVSVVIQCQPTVAGLRVATLTFGTNAPGAGTVTYTLTCTGSLTPVATGTSGVIGIPTPATPLAPTAIPFVPATGVVVEVTGLAVRSGPYLGASLLNVARPGNTYNILAKSNDEGPYTWYLIVVGKVTGWVSGKYLEVSGSVDTVPFGGSIFDQIDGAPDIGVRLTTDAIIDMRRRPSPRTTIVTTIPADAEVIVLGRTIQERNTFWLHVSYNGVVGWIPSLPVSMRGPVDILPSR